PTRRSADLIRRLCVRISNCSRESLSMWGERSTVKTFRSVGKGTGPDTEAPVRLAVSTILSAELSRIWWSNAFSRMRIFCLTLAICASSSPDYRTCSVEITSASTREALGRMPFRALPHDEEAEQPPTSSRLVWVAGISLPRHYAKILMTTPRSEERGV